MINDDKDIIKLVIDAENLATDDLIEITQDIRVLGDEAEETNKDLSKLKIDKSVIDSYKLARSETLQLREELSKSEVAYVNLKKEVKANKNATDAQREAVSRSNLELKAQRQQLRSQESAYNKVSAQAKQLGVDSKNVAEIQGIITAEIKSTTASISGLNTAYAGNIKKLKEKVIAEKKARVVEKDKLQAIEKAVALIHEEALVIDKQINKQRELAAETKRVTAQLKKYEIALVKLNAERDAGKISAGNAIRREKALREQYKLTEKQVLTSRNAIKADGAVKKSGVKNTDLLTQSTRRLAQAYTLLIAAQGATRAIATSITNYGDLEVAITKVEKTTGEARSRLNELTEQIVELSTDVTPTATNELLRMAEVAGQLGITGTDNLLKMVAAADALEVSTNLAGDEAATLLTRILGMTGEGIPKIDALASSVVSLGNNFAVAEDEILTMTKEVVNGTQSLNIGSAAAAAYGTVLKEMGQTGERARSSMFKLSQAIKSGVEDGGDDLERLIQYTGQTADELEKNLGERPEAVLTALINGFAKARDNGENLSDILGAMGINGIEASSTLEALVNGSDRLNEALGTSNKAFIEQNAHFKEAAKAYSTQEAAIGKLTNRFTDLTVKIGEAFSDETDAAIRGANAAIEDSGETVVEFMNLVGELGEALLEVGGSFDNFGAIFTGAASDISILDFAIMSVRQSFNTLQIAVNAVILGVQTFVLASAEMVNFFNENTISDEWFTNFRQGMKETAEDITRDMEDMNNANADFYKESSASYRDLGDIVKKYGSIIGELSVEEQKQIAIILKRGTYLESDNKLYRQLTATIVAKNREIEQGNIVDKIQLEQNEKSATLAAERLKAITTETDVKTGSIIANRKYTISQEEANKRIAEHKDLLDKGFSTLEQYNFAVNSITVNTEKHTKVVETSSKTLADAQVVTESFTVASKRLFESYDDGTITAIELQKSYDSLVSSYDSIALATGTNSDATQLMTERMGNLNKVIDKTQLDITAYETALGKAGITAQESATITAKLGAEEAKLSALRQEKTVLMEQEALTYPELIVLQKKYSDELAELTSRFIAGTIAKGEYAAKSGELKQALAEIQTTLGDNTSTVEVNTQVTKKAVGVTKAQTEALARNSAELQKNANHAGVSAAYTGRWLALNKQLNEELDYTSLSYEELSAELNTVNREMQDFNLATASATHDLIGILRPLDDMTRKIQARKVAVIEETQALNNWINRVNAGSVSMEELAGMARRADGYFTELSGNQLDPLLAAISEAESRFRSLDATINASISDVQDRLDTALGNFEDIRERAFQREVAELEALLQEARAYGNNTQVAELQAAIAKLKKAQDLEFKDEFSKKNSTTYDKTTTAKDTSFGSNHRKVVETRLTSPSGTTRSVFVDDDGESLDNMLNSLTELGEINTGG